MALSVLPARARRAGRPCRRARGSPASGQRGQAASASCKGKALRAKYGMRLGVAGPPAQMVWSKMSSVGLGHPPRWYGRKFSGGGRRRRRRRRRRCRRRGGCRCRAGAARAWFSCGLICFGLFCLVLIWFCVIVIWFACFSFGFVWVCLVLVRLFFFYVCFVFVWFCCV